MLFVKKKKTRIDDKPYTGKYCSVHYDSSTFAIRRIDFNENFCRTTYGFSHFVFKTNGWIPLNEYDSRTHVWTTTCMILGSKTTHELVQRITQIECRVVVKKKSYIYLK